MVGLGALFIKCLLFGFLSQVLTVEAKFCEC